jgi:uncharacterized protein (TIGR03435 family)
MTTSWINVAGWTLVHFLWQGAAIAALTGCVLRLLRYWHPQWRYVTACTALAGMLAAPAITAVVLTSAPRVPFADSIRAFRSPQGAIVGVSITPPRSPASVSGSAPSPPAELRLPAAVDTDGVFSVLVTLWLAGVVILFGRLTAGCWRIRTLQAAARFEAPSRWQAVAEEIASRLGLTRRFKVIDSISVATPTVVGWLRPIILLPVAAMSGLSATQVEAILAHELAHIRRHDFLINFLQTIAETLLFYHPAVWWLSSRIRTEREHCCDDVAVAVSGDAAEYAAALAELATWSLSSPALTMAATRGPLVERVRRLLRLPDVDRKPRRTAVAVAIVLTSLVAIGMLGAMLRAQPIADDAEQFGPDGINRLLGFNLFPGPVQLPEADPIDARAWGVTVGSGPEFSMIGFAARSVIRQAYGIDGMPVVGGPEWIDRETFDVSAPATLTLNDGRPDEDEIRAALQQMLEGQLGLRTHRETRAFPAYALVAAESGGRLGPSLKPSVADCVDVDTVARRNRDLALQPTQKELESVAQAPTTPERAQTIHRLQQRIDAQRQVAVTQRVCGIDNNFFGLSGARVTMGELATEFHRTHYPLAPDRTIVDRTGLTGAYDFELRFGLLPIAAIGHANYVFGRLLHPLGVRSVFTALPEQLGLKLVEATISREVLVIDEINRPR